MKYNEQGLIKAKEHAKAKGGACLSNEYVNWVDKMTWKCSNQNHKPWNASYNNVISCNSWCPECMDQKNHDGLERAKEQARLKGGECLSTEYFNSTQKMLWKCSCPSHQTWIASYASVLYAHSWCPECANKKPKNPKGLERAKEHAKSKGGDCLSTEYLGTRNPLIWKCSNINHKPWTARASSVLNMGSWCPECWRKDKGASHD